MNTRDFCFWLQGYFEVHRASDTPMTGLNADQIECIKKHLDMVFVHDIDSSMGGPEKQKLLNELHDKAKKSEPWYSKGARPRC